MQSLRMGLVRGLAVLGLMVPAIPAFANDEASTAATAASVPPLPQTTGSAESDPPAIDPAVVNPAMAEPLQSAKPSTLPQTGGVAADGSVYDFLGDGERHEIPGRGFSLKVPSGWEIYTRHPTLSLLMQIPKEKNQKYQRTIQIASFAGPRFMDEKTAHEYETLIVRKFSEATAAVENYRVRNHKSIELADGREAILFYTEFKIDGVELMQAHVLASAADRHFLATYTDVSEHFEGEKSEQYLSEAWETMISLELQSPTPSRYQSFVNMSYIVGALLLLMLVVLGGRWVWARRAYRLYTKGAGGDVDEEAVRAVDEDTSDLADDDEDDDVDEDDDEDASLSQLGSAISTGTPMSAEKSSVSALPHSHTGDLAKEQSARRRA